MGFDQVCFRNLRIDLVHITWIWGWRSHTLFFVFDAKEAYAFYEFTSQHSCIDLEHFGILVTLTRMLPKRKPQYRLHLVPVSVLIIIISFMLLYYYYLAPSSSFTGLSKTMELHSLQCSSQALALGERFMWYAPHSGFSNQLSEFKNAVLMAGILNRTLIVPPILDHHAVALGSCPKFRVLDPNEIRISVWDHVIELIREGRLVNVFVTLCQFRGLCPVVMDGEDWKQWSRCIICPHLTRMTRTNISSTILFWPLSASKFFSIEEWKIMLLCCHQIWLVIKEKEKQSFKLLSIWE